MQGEIEIVLSILFIHYFQVVVCLNEHRIFGSFFWHGALHWAGNNDRSMNYSYLMDFRNNYRCVLQVFVYNAVIFLDCSHRYGKKLYPVKRIL